MSKKKTQCVIIFEVYSNLATYVITVPQRYRQSDRQTDRQTDVTETWQYRTFRSIVR